VIKLKKMKLARHVACMEEEECIKGLLVKEYDEILLG
jgi:hypothetical protein